MEQTSGYLLNPDDTINKPLSVVVIFINVIEGFLPGIRYSTNTFFFQVTMGTGAQKFTPPINF